MIIQCRAIYIRRKTEDVVVNVTEVDSFTIPYHDVISLAGYDIPNLDVGAGPTILFANLRSEGVFDRISGVLSPEIELRHFE